MDNGNFIERQSAPRSRNKRITLGQKAGRYYPDGSDLPLYNVFLKLLDNFRVPKSITISRWMKIIRHELFIDLQIHQSRLWVPEENFGLKVLHMGAIVGI